MSIKVAVRVRPFNDREKAGASKCCIAMVSKHFGPYLNFSRVPRQRSQIPLAKTSHTLSIIAFGHMMASMWMTRVFQGQLLEVTTPIKTWSTKL